MTDKIVTETCDSCGKDFRMMYKRYNGPRVTTCCKCLSIEATRPVATKPTLVAQAGWRERMEEAIRKLEEDCADYARSLSDKCYEKVEGQREVIDTLMDELVELPPPTTDDIPPGAKTIAEVFGTEYALRLAARLIQDAALISAGRDGNSAS